MRDPDATSIEKALAIAEGAAEGFAEQSRDANLPAVVGAAVETVKESVRAVRDEIPRSEPAGPSHGPASGDGDRLADRGAPTMPATGAAEATVGRIERYADSLKVASKRAAEAPAAIQHEVRDTVKKASKDAKTLAIGYALAAVFGLFALAFLSVLVAVALNRSLGEPWGWLVVGVLYVIGAGISYVVAKGGRNAMRKHTREGVNGVREELRDVKDAFRNLRSGGPGAGV